MKEVKITLDKERTLKLDLNAMVAFEDATGKSLFNFKANNISSKDIRALLWSCLIRDDKALTLEQVGEMVTFDNMGLISEKIEEIFDASMPEGKEDDTPLAESLPTG